jgi:N-methylhydantoinase A
LASDVVKDYSRTVLWRVAKEIPQAQLSREFSALEKTAAEDFRRESWQGRPQYRRNVDLRYRGQGYELNLPLTKNLLRDFKNEHQRRYGYTHPNREIEIVTLRLRAVVSSPKLEISMEHLGAARPERRSRASSTALVLFDGKRVEAKILSREELKSGKKYSGPAIITEYSATTVVSPGKCFRLDHARNVVIGQCNEGGDLS